MDLQGREGKQVRSCLDRTGAGQLRPEWYSGDYDEFLPWILILESGTTQGAIDSKDRENRQMMMNPYDRGGRRALWTALKDGQWHDRDTLVNLPEVTNLDGMLSAINRDGSSKHHGEFWITKSRLAVKMEFRVSEIQTQVLPPNPTQVQSRTGLPGRLPDTRRVPAFDGTPIEINPNNFSTQVVDKMDRYIRSVVVGQDAAVDAVVDVYQRLVADMHDPDRPLGNILFLGPTGTGKTRTVEALAEYLYQGEPDAKSKLIKINCGEYQESHAISKLIGAPAGYLGYGDTTVLSERKLNNFSKVLNRKVTVILFDEIEKAHRSVFQILLGIMDKGEITLSSNEKIDLKHCVVVMTSNLGAAAIADLLRNKTDADIFDNQDLLDTVRNIALEAARTKFSPEFFNRLDEVIAFLPLPKDAIQRIVVLELQNVDKRISKSRGGQVFIKYDESTIQYLMGIGFDPQYGARALKRAIDQVVVKPISKLLSGGAITTGDSIRVSADKTGTRFFKIEPKKAA